MDDNELDAGLDEEERELLDAFERGEWQPVADRENAIARLQSYAEATIRKDRRVNIRISTPDLLALQNIALEEGIPYQTLMSSILHKYVNGRLVEQSRHPTFTVREQGESYKE